MKELPRCIQWSEEVLSVIDGIRNGDTRVLFRVTNATHKRTKSSYKEGERGVRDTRVLAYSGRRVVLEIRARV